MKCKPGSRVLKMKSKSSTLGMVFLENLVIQFTLDPLRHGWILYWLHNSTQAQDHLNGHMFWWLLQYYRKSRRGLTTVSKKLGSEVFTMCGLIIVCLYLFSHQTSTEPGGVFHLWQPWCVKIFLPVIVSVCQYWQAITRVRYITILVFFFFFLLGLAFVHFSFGDVCFVLNVGTST